MASDTVITDPAQVDAAWLGAVLRREGALAGGEVESVDVHTEPGRDWSRMTRLRLRYSAGAQGLRPERLLLKHCADEAGSFGPDEVAYYRHDYLGLADAPMPRCFDAAYEASPRRYHLLLEDLSATHDNFDRLEWTRPRARRFAESLAALHAHAWGPAGLRAIGREPPARGRFARYIVHVGQGLEPFLDGAAGQLPPGWAPRLRELLGRFETRCARRALDPRGLTQIHSDLNPGNLLAPIAEGAAGDGPVRFIDRQPFDWSLQCWLGASDLACAMVLWWDTPLRRALQGEALAHYHRSLLARGVHDYDFDQLQRDYRLCVVEALCTAVEWCVLETDRERMRWLWSRHLERAIAAYDELGCAALWEAPT